MPESDWTIRDWYSTMTVRSRAGVVEDRKVQPAACELVKTDTTMVPDFYARLAVDPSADRSEIEAALKRMQPAWSMGTRNPKTRHENQLYLDEIPALRRALLSDPASRAAYDADLAVTQMAERERKLDELERRVRLRAAKGGLAQLDRVVLRDEAVRLGIGEGDLLRIIRPIPNLVDVHAAHEETGHDAERTADVLDPSTRRQIRVALCHLGCRDLYDALGLASDAPGTYITARADEERQRWMKKTQVTAEKTAWLEIVAHAQSHLGSPSARARYDRTLTVEAEESFDALAEFTLKGLGRLDAGSRAALVEEAAGLGISRNRADRLIGRACRRLGVTYEAVSPAPVVGFGTAQASSAAAGAVNGVSKFTLLRCRHCSGVTEMSPVARKSPSARCRHCGASLKWECPVCHQNLWVDEPRCACGFRLALRDAVVRHFDAAQQAFRSFDLTGALEHLERVQELAPDLNAARNGIARVRQRQADIARARLAFDTARAGGKLATARAAVEAWSRLVDPSSSEIRTAWAELGPSLSRAEELAAKARKLEQTDPPAARMLYRQSLAVASDLPSALSGLERTPPDPPTTLDAKVLGDRIRLLWTPPPPDGLGPLTFVVLRKRHGALQHPADGTRIAEVSTPEFDDTHATPGESVGYAVLSKRGAAVSIAAISLGPLVFLADVRDAHVVFGENEVEVTWTPPHGVTEVRVIRQYGSQPASPRDGDRIPAALDRALDRELDLNQICYYGIFAIYKMPDGKLFPSPGVVVTARPQPAVAPLERPRLLQEPTGRVRIEWIEPARGFVRIVRTANPLAFPTGSRLSATEAGALDGQWLEPTGPDQTFDPNPPLTDHCYYTPVTIWRDTWTVGHGVAQCRVGDPSELRATRASSGLGTTPGSIRVMLQWRWAANSTSALVVARQAAPPQGPSDPRAITAIVSRAEYDRHDCFGFGLPSVDPQSADSTASGRTDGGASRQAPSPACGPWYIKVYSVIDQDGVRALSPGLEPTAATTLPGPHPEVTVSYSLTRPWLPGLPWSLTFRTDPPGKVLPPMVVVSHPRAVPVSVDDGQIATRLPAVRDGARFLIRGVNLSRHGVRVFLDPNVEPDAVSPIRFRHPETGSTRV
jgi:hypothetical protein